MLIALFIKLKVLKSYVTSTILNNCEAFGKVIPKKLSTCYTSLVKSALGVRKSTPNEIVLIECGFLPLEALIYSRQLRFYQKFKEVLQPQSSRHVLFRELLETCPPYLQHYVDLERKYNSKEEIFTDYLNKMKAVIRQKASSGSHYK